VLSRIDHTQRKAVAFARLSGAQLLIEPGRQHDSVRHAEVAPRRGGVRQVAITIEIESRVIRHPVIDAARHNYLVKAVGANTAGHAQTTTSIQRLDNDLLIAAPVAD